VRPLTQAQGVQTLVLRVAGKPMGCGNPGEKAPQAVVNCLTPNGHSQYTAGSVEGSSVGDSTKGVGG
jgi:hypothetical protein